MYLPRKPVNETLNFLELFKPLFSDVNKKWVGQNMKYDLTVLKWYGVELTGQLFDTMLAHYLIEPEGTQKHGLSKRAVSPLRACCHRRTDWQKRKEPANHA